MTCVPSPNIIPEPFATDTFVPLSIFISTKSSPPSCCASVIRRNGLLMAIVIEAKDRVKIDIQESIEVMVRSFLFIGISKPSLEIYVFVYRIKCNSHLLLKYKRPSYYFYDRSKHSDS